MNLLYPHSPAQIPRRMEQTICNQSRTVLPRMTTGAGNMPPTQPADVGSCHHCVAEETQPLRALFRQASSLAVLRTHANLPSGATKFNTPHLFAQQGCLLHENLHAHDGVAVHHGGHLLLFLRRDYAEQNLPTREGTDFTRMDCTKVLLYKLD